MREAQGDCCLSWHKGSSMHEGWWSKQRGTALQSNPWQWEEKMVICSLRDVNAVLHVLVLGVLSKFLDTEVEIKIRSS